MKPNFLSKAGVLSFCIGMIFATCSTSTNAAKTTLTAPSVSPITSHILDAALGKPATNVKVRLLKKYNNTLMPVDEQMTDADGRIKNFKMGALIPGDYELIFMTKPYFEKTGRNTFYPQAVIDFTVVDASQHYHVPLLISPYAYSTYRGS